MKSVSNIIGAGGSGFQSVSGECGEHGPSTVLAFAGREGWYCAKCFEAKVAGEEAAKAAAKRGADALKSAKIPLRYVDQRFTAHTTPQREVRGIAKAFKDLIASAPCWAVLILSGPVGTGKTQLACEMVEAFVKNLGRTARYTTAADMISEIQGAYGREGRTAEAEVQRFSEYDLLVIDEIDAKRDTEDSTLQLTSVINRRYSNLKPVIVITNQAVSTLGRFVGDRVDDRLHENAFICLFDWDSFRRGGAPALAAA